MQINAFDKRVAEMLLVGIGFLSGCTQYHLGQKDIRPFYNSSIMHVEGLRSALDKSRDTPLRVLLVHGMLTSNVGYSRTLQKQIIAKLGLDLVEQKPEHSEIERGYDVTVFDGPQPLNSKIKIPLSQLTRSAWLDRRDNKERLVFYEVLWAPPRDVVKNRFIACFESDLKAEECMALGPIRPNTDRQGFVNRFAKNSFMVGGFADATIVLSNIGDVLRDDVNLAMCMVATDVLGRHTSSTKRSERCDLSHGVGRSEVGNMNERLSRAPFFAITHSLGSFLLLDGQIRFAAKRAEQQEDVIQEMASFHLLDNKTVFMRANQISLLHLARLQVACEQVPCPNRLLPSVNDLWSAPAELSQMTTYVAFNDHNDLLGFELPPYFKERGIVGTFVNVSVRNPGWWIPGILKNPLAAHLASDRNPAIIEAIVEGFDLPPR
jgi:hypothetical protein